MADKEQIVTILSELPVQILKSDWVKSIWDSEFTDIPAVDSSIEEELQDTIRLVESFSDLQPVLQSWNTEEQDGNGLWTVLVENDISQKNFIALLTYLVDVGSKRTSSFVQKQLALFSACSYMKLIAIPGSGAFKVFHPQLYDNCVELLKQWNSQLSQGAASKRKRSSLSSQQSQSRKSKSSKRNRNIEALFEDEDDNSEDEVEELSPHQVLGFKKLLHTLLQDVVILLDVFSLRQSESSSHKTVQLLAQLTRSETDKFDGSFDFDRIPIENLSPTALAYRGLVQLCQPLHGNVISILNAVCKNLLPGLLMIVGENKVVAAQTIPNCLLSVKNHTVNFICHLLDKCRERAHASVRTLLQHMCTKVPDRMEYRVKVSEAVVNILHCMPAEPYGKMVEWFYKLSRNSKISNRGFALDIVTQLLQGKKKVDLTSLPAELAPYLEHRYLVAMIVARCSDSAPAVRARAIAFFSQCLASKDTNIVGTVRDIVTPKHSTVRNPNAPHLIHTPAANSEQTESTSSEPSTSPADQTEQGPPLDPQDAVQTPASNNNPSGGAVTTPFLSVNFTPGFNPNLVDDDGVISMLRRRARDEKVNVRKAALQAIENFIRFEAANYRKEDIGVLKERCCDPSLTVRKQAMQSLTDLLMDKSDDEQLQRMWLDGVLPLVIDRETTLQEKCLEFLEEIFLNNIISFHRSNGSQCELVWGLLGIMAKYESVDLRRYLQKACRHWTRLGKFKPSLISALESHIDTINNQGAWMLLAELASGSPKINHQLVLEYWETNANLADGCDYGTLQRVLTVLSCICKKLSTEKRNHIIADLKDRLKRFDSPPEIIAVTINTLSKMCEAAAEGEERQSDKDNWCEDLLQTCDQYLSHVVLEEGDPEDENLVIRHLFTLGEISQLCPAKTPKRVFLLVQSLIASPCLLTSQSSSQESLSSSQPSQASQALSQFHGSHMSSRIRAFAFITLGKLCLQNENLAKKCVAALARELETSADPAIRNNVVIIMCDLCVRYTTTADRYVCNIASCLKDPAPLIRKQTLTLLTRLLQEDFIKWKNVLFYRFISTLLDESEEIKSFAEFCLKHMLLMRHPTMFFQHFVECIFHFNGYENHSVYNKFSQSDRDKQMFSLKGKESRKSRLKLYLFMLDLMTDEHRFKISAKICQEVLGAVVDGVMPLDEDSSALLQDALVILSSKEIKLSSLRTKPQDDLPGDEQEMAAVVIAHAKKTFITQVVKKNVIENIVPIVVSLKHMLEQHRSPVLKDLMFYLQELVKDFKNEVKEILNADRQLANEIEFDLRKFEEQQIELEKQSNTIPQGTPGPASAAGSPHPASVQGSPASAARSPRVPPVPGSPASAAGSPGSPPVRESPAEKTSSNSPVQKSPKSHGSPKIRTPVTSPRVAHDGSPKQATSLDSSGELLTRDSSLTTLAILNSAKKAFERNQQLMKAPNSPLTKLQRRQSKAIETARKNSLLSDEDSSHDSSPAETDKESDTSGPKTPRRQLTKKNIRAISTPSAAWHNITFHLDKNVTLGPPSPIPTSLPAQLCDLSDDPGEPCTPVKKWNKENKEKEKQVVFMFSPDKPSPKPRKWNVKSSAPVKTKSKRISSDTDSEASVSVFEDTRDASISIAKSRPVRKASRSRKT